MAAAHLSIDSSSLRQLQERVQVMAGLDTTSLMPRLGEYLLTSTQDRFKTQTDPDGQPWEALKHPSLKKKNQRKILTLDGFLRKNLRYQVLGETTVQVGSNEPYAATHQYGRDAIPARPFLGLSAQDRQEIQAIIADWAAKQGFKLRHQRILVCHMAQTLRQRIKLRRRLAPLARQRLQLTRQRLNLAAPAGARLQRQLCL